MTAFRQRRGRQAEEYALRFLQKRGYRLIARNVRYPFGELDLVLHHPHRGLVVVEVRSLDRRTGIHPFHTLTAAKRRRLERALQAFLQQHPRYRNLPIHLDVVGIIWGEAASPRVEHLQDAFGF